MECQNNVVNSSLGSDDKRWKPFLRQLFVASSVWAMFFCIGIVFGSSTVTIPQLRRNNVTVSDDMASWMSSTFSYAAIPWIYILTTLGHGVGRKKTSIFACCVTTISFIGFSFSTTPTHILIAQAGFGVTQASVETNSIIAVSEYTSPEYRGIFLCVKSASFLWGIWVSNAIGTFTLWRYIPIVGFVVSLHSLTAFFWPESPHWLASKNRFTECRQAHRWLKGTSGSAERELNELIRFRTEYVEEKLAFNHFLRREFVLPLFVSMLAVVQFQLSGKFVITIYAIDIMKKITDDEATAYATMLILDGITVFSAYAGCVITKYFMRRTIWLVTSSIAVLFLLILSLYLYLVKLAVVNENVYFSIFLLAGFSLSISCGPIILATSLYAELLPSRYQNITIMIVGCEFVVLHGTMLKVAPSFIKVFGLHGAILLYALSSGFALSLMYLYLPETKDKTLLEIEEYFKDKRKVEESSTLVS